MGQGFGDYIYGGTEDDALFGGSDDDWVEGNDGSDFLFGGHGVDRFAGGNGEDCIDGGYEFFNKVDTLYGDAAFAPHNGDGHETDYFFKWTRVYENDSEWGVADAADLDLIIESDEIRGSAAHDVVWENWDRVKGEYRADGPGDTEKEFRKYGKVTGVPFRWDNRGPNFGLTISSHGGLSGSGNWDDIFQEPVVTYPPYQLTVDMSKQHYRDGAADQIAAHVVDGRFELWVNGSIFHSDAVGNITGLTIKGSNDAETIRIDGSVKVPVTVDGGGGLDHLLVDDQGALSLYGNSTTYDVTAANVTRTTRSLFKPVRDPPRKRRRSTTKNLEGLEIKAGNATNTFNVLSTGTPLTLTGGTFNNTFHFGDNGSLDPVRGNVTINAQAGGSDELILDDSSDADKAFALHQPHLYGRRWENHTARTKQRCFGSIPPKPRWIGSSHQLTVNYQGVENMTLLGGDGGNTVNVLGTAGGAELHFPGRRRRQTSSTSWAITYKRLPSSSAASGADIFSLGGPNNSLYYLDGLSPTSTAAGGADQLTVDGRKRLQSAGDQHAFTLTDQFVRWTHSVRVGKGFEGLVDPSIADHRFDYGGFEQLNAARERRRHDLLTSRARRRAPPRRFAPAASNDIFQIGYGTLARRVRGGLKLVGGGKCGSTGSPSTIRPAPAGSCTRSPRMA